ncbi:MAG: AP-3 complex subunit delta [Vezdaea aestivalis]|nr:MAG: AP-3 complex subunit delta [Vezdaea aestivalis]
MDLKATALLKLVYLEMFGHDMSWASFHVLEVMSSAQYLQKRVGYLAAVQSFCPDTDVLMLATNLLKKDLTSATTQIMTLPLATLPHLANPQLAMSLLADLIPRLSHSKPAVRKKTILTLYRLALVYPETLRVAWPKIKERLMDDKEDSSVTGACINVICELGWRRPRDFVPLAPRLFELLVDGGNNWMGIKIIKLFAQLCPLEPRLVRKLLPPLTSIIKTTPAMSLLYECINGIIQGGILDGTDKTGEGDEVATLCVEKLRGMIATENDRNLRYVALIAFKKIVASYPYLADLHQDVILSCIDDADISIRLRTLDLLVGMVSGDNLELIVNRLLSQLQSSRDDVHLQIPSDNKTTVIPLEPAEDSDQEDPEEALHSTNNNNKTEQIQLPEDYKSSIVRTILTVCAMNTYGFIIDFSWYIGVLVQLTKLVPRHQQESSRSRNTSQEDSTDFPEDLSIAVGSELRNVAVRVQEVRRDATQAAETLLQANQRDQTASDIGPKTSGYLGPVVWVVGEYSELLGSPERTLEALLAPPNIHIYHQTLALYLQALIKIYAQLTCSGNEWNREKRAMASLRTARVLQFLDLLTSHPSLEVQERAVGFAEFLRITAEALSGSKFDSEDNAEAPLLLTSALPSLLIGIELKPVSRDAQRKIPLPAELNIDEPINLHLVDLLQAADRENREDFGEQTDFDNWYNKRIDDRSVNPSLPDAPAADWLSSSYQKDGTLDSDNLDSSSSARTRKKARDRDDPFYIQPSSLSGTSTPIHDILKDSNGDALDVDAIPILPLDLEGDPSASSHRAEANSRSRVKTRRAKIVIEQDEDLFADPDENQRSSLGPKAKKPSAAKKGLLGVDSSALMSLSIDGDATADGPAQQFQDKQNEDAEMAKALKEVERLRLEMQRASERIEAAQGVPREGTLVKKKKRRKVGAAVEGQGETGAEGAPVGAAVKKKKKKKEKIEDLADRQLPLEVGSELEAS